jgi:Ala-tRNA(Pro) deacylase
MSISHRLTDYLDRHGAQYEICEHEPSRTSAETARSADIPAAQLAKSVLLEDDAGCMLAVVPSDKSVMLGQLSAMLGRKGLHLCDEQRIASMFDDCTPGALPPVGMAWGVETIVDDELDDTDVVYMEGGDHERLLRMSTEQFRELMGPALHGHFCRSRMH